MSCFFYFFIFSVPFGNTRNRTELLDPETELPETELGTDPETELPKTELGKFQPWLFSEANGTIMDGS
jgi:hypothetical protein